MNRRPFIQWILLATAATCTSLNLSAQDSLQKLTWKVFGDIYYAYDFARPAHHKKAPFLFNHNHHNEFNVNLILASVSYNDSATRAQVGIMAGSYPQANLAAEPELFRNIYEANAGVRLGRTKDIWLDAGILPSHIGSETAISKDCWTLTRSIQAENSPYYETGLRVSYRAPNRKWYVAALLLNGWQRIKRADGNNTVSLGSQVTYTPTDRFLINSSTFIGNDKPDSVKKWRYFHNLYSIWQLSDKWRITLGIDVGLEQEHRRSSVLKIWYSPLALLRYQNKNWAVTARAEYYEDEKGVIVPLVDNKPFHMQGYSLNIDRKVHKLLFRVEGRTFRNDTAYFINPSGISLSNFQLTTSLSFAF